MTMANRCFFNLLGDGVFLLDTEGIEIEANVNVNTETLTALEELRCEDSDGAQLSTSAEWEGWRLIVVDDTGMEVLDIARIGGGGAASRAGVSGRTASSSLAIFSAETGRGASRPVSNCLVRRRPVDRIRIGRIARLKAILHIHGRFI